MVAQNQTLGRGKLYFGQFAGGVFSDKVPMAYLGNTPAFSVSQNVTTVDHFDSDGGVKVKDLSVTLQADMSAAFTADDISLDNLALWFLGEKLTETEAGSAGASETVVVGLGKYHQLGVTDALPSGVRNVSAVAASNSTGSKAGGTLTFGGQPTADDTVTIGGTAITFKAAGAVGSQVNIGANATATAQALRAYINATPALGVTATGDATVLTLEAINAGTAGNAITLAKSGTYPAVSAATLTGGAAPTVVAAEGNFEVDADNGLIYVLPDAAGINEGDSIVFTYDIAAATRQYVVGQGAQIFGRLMFVSTAQVGAKRNHLYRNVKISPNGNMDLKGDTWQQMQFNVEVLAPPFGERAIIG